MLSRAALLAIGGYQRWLSPQKGWSCAYRLAHGGPGCSGFAKRAIAEQGFVAAWPAIRQRFRACHDAAFLLQGTPPPEDKRRRSRWCDGWIPDLSGCCDLCSRRSGRSQAAGCCDGSPDGCDCTPGGCGD